MTRRRLRWLQVGLLAGAGAGLLEMASALNPVVALGDDTALIMGYAGTSDPDQTYVSDVMNTFINPTTPAFPGQPVFPGYSPLVQPTPEGADFTQVLSQGPSQLNEGIATQIAEGHKVLVYGYSESTAIATQEMVNLAALPADQQFDPADLRFVLVEDLNNPDGGFLNRLPFLATLNFPATPADTPYETAIYTIEYSGSSDFPKYPLDLLADANAFAGFIDLHPFLLPGWPTGFNASELAGAVLEPTSPGYDGATQYFLIPTQDLPILDGLRSIPGVGPAMADLMQPDMRVIIDLGYDRTDPADVVTPAVWTMPNVDWTTVNAELALGAQQGWTAAMVDLGMLPTSELPNAYPYLPDIPGLQAGSAAATAASTVAEDLTGQANLSTVWAELSSYATTELSALLGSGAATDVASSLSADLMSGLTGLFTNPMDFLAF
jgi:diacyltrehalose acyltransferase